jgi:D-lactate dehydrogenase
MKVVAYDAYPDHDWAAQTNITYDDLDKVLATGDVVTLHIPYSDTVHNLMNAEKFALMKPTAIIVNTARGELVDTGALIDALDNGHLAGAALDVFEGESLVDVHHELKTLRSSMKKELLQEGLELDVLGKLPNVVLTNHNAFNSTEALGRINQTSADNITKFLAGATQNNVIT